MPKANRPRKLNKRLTGGSVLSFASSSGEDGDGGEDGDEGDEEDGWSGFGWGLGKLSWATSNKNLGASSSSGNAQEGYVPSTTDFARNFGEEGGAWLSVDGSGEIEGDYEEEEEEDEEGQPFLLADQPLYPGLYRAMYAFESEGSSEMALEEGQVVRVVGRGGGIGWAVVVREEGCEGEGGVKTHALVPESYLEVVKLDEEDVPGEGS